MVVSDGVARYAQRCLFDFGNEEKWLPSRLMSIGLIRFLDVSYRRTKKWAARGDCFRSAVRELLFLFPVHEPE